MMLDSALAFEKLIKNPKHGSKDSSGKVQVTWDNPSELEAYIDKLQAAADRLTSENRRLRKCHYNISDKVQIRFVLTMYYFSEKYGEISLRSSYSILFHHIC